MWHHNVDLLAYHDLGGRSGFKLALQEAAGRFFLYSGAFTLLTPSVDRSFGRLIRALVRALPGWSDVPEPGREVQAQ